MDQNLNDALVQISEIGVCIRCNTEDGLSKDATIKELKNVSSRSYNKLKTVINGLNTKYAHYEKLELILNRVEEIKDLANDNSNDEDIMFKILNLWSKIESKLEDIAENS